MAPVVVQVLNGLFLAGSLRDHSGWGKRVLNTVILSTLDLFSAFPSPATTSFPLDVPVLELASFASLLFLSLLSQGSYSV